MNSAQAWSRDRVEDLFDQSRCDGSVPLGFIETLVGSADLVGRWAIRAHIRARGYSRRGAQKIMSRYPMSTTVEGVPYTWKESLDAYLDERAMGIREAQLQRAAALRQRPIQIWHISGPRSDD